jgi:hypothetical protein
MTLVLTSLAPVGVVMAADTMVTERAFDTHGEIQRRYLRGVTKLRQIPKLKAGISYWGKREIGDYKTDIWIKGSASSGQDPPLRRSLKRIQDFLTKRVPEMTAEVTPVLTFFPPTPEIYPLIGTIMQAMIG